MEDREDSLRTEASAASPERWHEIAASPEFARFHAQRRRVTLALLGVFALPVGTFLILCAYARPFMRRSVDGGLTVAYVWLLSLTVLGWVLVWIYLRSAERLSEMAQRTLAGSESGSAATAPARENPS